MMRVRITMRCFCVSSNLPSPDDEVQITVRCLRVSSDLPSPDDEGKTKVVSVERH